MMAVALADILDYKDKNHTPGKKEGKLEGA